MSGLWTGFRLPLEGARLLLRERSLWSLAVVPFLLSALALAGALALTWGFSGELSDWATRWVPRLAAEAWYEWLWIGPGQLLIWLLQALCLALVHLLAFALAFVLGMMLANVLAGPFLDALAARVEGLVTGGVDDRTASSAVGMLGEALGSVLGELRKLLFYLAIVAPLTLAGLLLPGAQLLTGPAIAAFTIFFLPLDYASYTLDRRRIGFRERRRWAADRATLMFGFGSAAFLACAVPLLNLLAMPLLVVAGTLLAVRYLPEEPPAEAGSSSTA